MEDQIKEQTDSEALSDGVSTIVEDILDNEPPITESVIEQDQVSDPGGIDPQEDEKKENPFPGLEDKYGRKFDPDIHLTDEKGYPLLNKSRNKGKIRIKAGAKPPLKRSKVAMPQKPDQDSVPEVKKVSMPPKKAGAIAANLTFRLGEIFGGEEWRPIVDEQTGANEAEFMSQAYTDYFQAKGVTDVSPGWILVIALASYAGPRLTMPKTQTRLQRFSKGLAKGFMWIKKKLGSNTDNESRANTRQDRDRQNHFSQTNEQGLEGAGAERISP